jgi:hypothetical protein
LQEESAKKYGWVAKYPEWFPKDLKSVGRVARAIFGA